MDIALSLYLVTFALSGYPLYWLLFNFCGGNAKSLNIALKVAAISSCSLVLFYFLLVAGLPLKSIANLQIISSTLSISYALWQTKKDFNGARTYGTIFSELPALALSALFLTGISVLAITEPIKEWDPRSIWFFHARMIYFAGALTKSGGWLEPMLDFAHIDYPKLLPGLAASVSSQAGFWNEYVPKIAIGLLALPCTFFVFGLAANGFWPAVLTYFLGFLSYREFVWNGYADSYLALIHGCGFLALTMFALKPKQSVVWIGFAMVFAGISASLKNEGTVLAASILAATVLICCFRFNNKVKSWLRNPRGIANSFGGFTPTQVTVLAALWTLVMIGPIAAWSIKKVHWGVPTPYDTPTNKAYLLRIFNNLTNHEAYTLIYNAALESLLGPLSLTLLSSVICAVVIAVIKIFSLQKFSMRSLFLNTYLAVIIFQLCFITVYSLVLILIFLGTPHELSWHLSTALERTSRPLAVCLFQMTGVVIFMTYRASLYTFLRSNWIQTHMRFKDSKTVRRQTA